MAVAVFGDYPGWVMGALIAVTLGFVVVCGVTLLITLSRSRTEQTAATTRERMLTALSNRASESEPAWESWVNSLSPRDRRALETAVTDMLRDHLEAGGGETMLHEVAKALGIGERADRALEDPNMLTRLEALATLTCLMSPVSVDRLLETCTDSPRTRAAAARLLYERREEYVCPGTWGTKLLLWEGREAISVYGLETLHALNEEQTTPLLSQAASSAQSWDRAVLFQVCAVLEHCEIIEPDSAFDWLLPLLEHDEPTARAAAIRAFKRHGHRKALRKKIQIGTLVTDESPQVREAVYRVLTYWGDPYAKELLEWAVITEENERCQLVAVRGLVSLEAIVADEQPAWPQAAWRWVRAELAVSERRRLAHASTEPASAEVST